MPHVDGETPDDTSSAAKRLATFDPNSDPREAALLNLNLDRFNIRMQRSGHSFLMSNATLIGLTSLLTLMGAILQSRASYPSISQRGFSPGRVFDPDFHSTLQNSIMQLLDLYVAVLPALRHRQSRCAYSR
ncbi:hypothetical protein H2201_006455 [Coniosporium apollinis]|uniref:Uncharacterized protein n=1 Tax=Coniosporium apollinis TaxID=61459 RepID=A0ABQ9NLW7_9PEZI|nr:hypothetical protein H2201_006455 [Coniosporium apollinis]